MRDGGWCGWSLATVCGGVAQLEEQGPLKPQVWSSSLHTPTMITGRLLNFLYRITGLPRNEDEAAEKYGMCVACGETRYPRHRCNSY